MDQELKQRQLELMDEIDRICRKHDIKYVLVGGTCLGAVRHHGMIPWDDDVDIAMYRKDYDRFVEVCKKELFKDYYVQDMDNTKGYGLVFGKLRDKNSVFEDQYSRDVNIGKGVWIDIFQYDDVSADQDIMLKEFYKVKRLNSFLTIKNGYKIELNSMKLKVQYYLVKFLMMFTTEKRLKQKINKILSKYSQQETGYLLPYGCQYNPVKERFTKEDFFDHIDVDFEGRKFPIYRNYDRYLSNLYGDYMKLPPVDQRGNMHSVLNLRIDKRSSE